MKKAKLIFGGLIVIVIIIGIVSAFKYDDFWNISFSSCLTLIIAMVFGYYYTKKDQDDNNKKAIYLELMHALQNSINDEKLYNISLDSDMEYLLMKKRKISNYIFILKKHSSQFSVDEEMLFIYDKFNEYSSFFGDHQDDKEYLAKSRKELLRPLELMEPKLFETMIKLFD